MRTSSGVHTGCHSPPAFLKSPVSSLRGERSRRADYHLSCGDGADTRDHPAEGVAAEPLTQTGDHPEAARVDTFASARSRRRIELGQP